MKLERLEKKVEVSIGKLNLTVVISPVLAGTVPLFLAYYDRAQEVSDYVQFFLKINCNNEINRA